jgi:hypothetical protein
MTTSIDQTKRFSLRAVLSLTTGRLLTEPCGEQDSDIDDPYKLLEWITMDTPNTCQFGRFAYECRPDLFRLFPELAYANANLDSLDKWLTSAPTCPQEGIKMWLTELRIMFPQIQLEYDVPQFPIAHAIKDPVTEIQELAPYVEIIAVQFPTPESDIKWPESLGE